MQWRDAEKDDDESKGPDAEKFECLMCGQKVLVSLSTMMGGRRLCLDCAASWYEDEDPDEPSPPR
jgi:hypothetical protein